MNHLVTSLLLLIPLALLAQQNPMVDNSVAELARPFVPSGWKVIATAKGDLNKDAAGDIALVIENTDIANIITNTDEGALPETFNTNPRYLLVLFKSENTYTLAAKDEDFIPSQDNPEIPCLVDPFVEAGGLEIKNGTLIITTQTFWSCGSWAIDDNTFTLRYQDGAFTLIGFDNHSGNRATGGVSEVSINYLTKKKSITDGGNMFFEEKDKPVTTWQKITVTKLLTLSDLSKDTEIDYWN